MLLNNRYRIIQILGGGGFGETFKAEDTQIPSNRCCVIKQLRQIHNNPQVYQLVQQRFQREAAILEELGDGSNQIPRLYAYFSENGQFYLVQEYIEGQTLTAKVQQQGLMSESSVKEILTSILPVLDYVHSKGIVHRDIKPDNILIRSADGKPILIDFGAVKETVGMTMTPSGNSTNSIVIGTPGFMPSEQSAGRPMFASDIYSLGLTAIYLLTGKMPQELATDPATGNLLWREYALSVTPSFATLLDKAIQFNARYRFVNVREMLEALQSGVSFPPTVPYTELASVTPQKIISVSPVPSHQPSHQGNGQRGIFLGSLIAGGLIGGSVVIGLTLNRQQPQQVTQQPETQPRASSTIQPSTPAFQPQDTIPSPTQVPSYTAPNTTTTPVKSQTQSSQLSETTPPPVHRPSPEEALQNYFLTINQGQYQTAWSQLSPNYQNNKRLHPKGYFSYIDWWAGQVQKVDVKRVSLVEASQETATVDTELKYQMKTGKVVPGSVRFSLLWDVENNKWVIANTK
ncbi:MAG: protein kinase [Stigonema ocellatum SAG 48.90 = DSM 106950]|nr:protein kinase [Stigonema ocellatum SAG 48.90 = DSM 106950]